MSIMHDMMTFKSIAMKKNRAPNQPCPADSKYRHGITICVQFVVVRQLMLPICQLHSFHMKQLLKMFAALKTAQKSAQKSDVKPWHL